MCNITVGHWPIAMRCCRIVPNWITQPRRWRPHGSGSRGRLVIDYVVPDYHALRPKACMGGWARRFITVTPAGKALPCHIAESLPGLVIPSVNEQSLAAIWYQFVGVRPIPRHRVDAGAVPIVRPAGDRLGWLPLSGFCTDR